MKIAVIGSRSITVSNLGDYLPQDTTELMAGGAKGVDTCVKQYARENGIPFVEYLPDCGEYLRGVPFDGNFSIVNDADIVIVFWDGKSKGTKALINYCEKQHKPVYIHIM